MHSQIMPLALIIAAASLSVTMSGFSPIRVVKSGYDSAAQFVQQSLPSFSKPNADPAQPSADVRPNAQGRVYSIAVDSTAVRTGPGSTYQVVAVLSKGTVVLVTETDPSGAWLRVATAEGTSGFVAQAALSPDVRMDALKDLGSFAKP